MRVLVITPFYMLFEFFLIKYLLLLICDVNDFYILALTVLVGLIHFFPMIFEQNKSRKLTRFLTTIDGVWMWASCMFLIDIVIIYLLNINSEIRLILLAIVPVLGVYNYCHAHKLVVKRKYLDLGEDVSIAHISDVHFGSVRHKEIINQIKDKLIELEDECDIVIISGDLADGSSVVEADDFMPFSDVKTPIVFTPGNHDFYPGIDNVVQACKNAGIIVLDNQSMEFGNLNIFGLTYSFSHTEEVDVKSFVKKDKTNVIIYHVPYRWDEFSEMGFKLQLSGHTHGGQFYPVVLFANKMFKYNMGLFKNEYSSYLNVTTGVGSMDTPMRWGTSSELVILKLKKEDS